MTLQLLISTLDDGIDSVAQLLLPASTGISYLVSWQHADGARRALPAALERDDVQVLYMDGRGLSRNRNNCLRHATADVLLIVDDDCRYKAEWLQAIIDTFESHPQVDIAAFMMQSEAQPKQYPDHSFSLGESPRGYYVTSFELAIRRTSIQGRLQFNEHFGLGAPLFRCGEEELLVHNALQLGMDVRFFPITVVRHDHATTQSSRAGEPAVLRGRGAFLYAGGYRRSMLVRPFTIARQLHKAHGVPYWHAVRYMLEGVFYMIFHPSIARAGIVKTDGQRQP